VKRLIIFLKAPRAGSVKTRLGQDIGMEQARAAYCELVDRLLENLSNLSEVELRVSPDDAEKEIAQWLKPNWRVTKQSEGDLTQRLNRAFEEAFQSGAKHVVIIGSDCPDVTEQDIHCAWESLASSENHFDVVLGPATDGGYWLVGLNKPNPVLFEEIPWSSEKVLEKTLALASSAGLKVKLLRTLSDVDTKADWERFQRAKGVLASQR
jgi:rSAM/selenodomain-associated transferase 1